MGPDHDARVTMFYSFPLGALFLFVFPFGYPWITGVFVGAGLLLIWIGWNLGTKSCLDIYNSGVYFRTAIRSYYISWSDVADIQYLVNTVFVLRSGKRIQCRIYMTSIMERLIWSHTRRGDGRKQAVATIKQAYESFQTRDDVLSSPFRRTWYLPSKLTISAVALASVVAQGVATIVLIQR